MRRVLKFGGAALADGATIGLALERIAEESRGPEGPLGPPVVVVSALKGVTDDLLEAARAATLGLRGSDPVRIRHRSVLGQLGLPSELLDRYWRELSELLAGISKRGVLGPAELDQVLSYGERMSARVVAAALNRAGHEATPVDAWDLGFLTDSNHGHARPEAGILGPIRDALAGIPGLPVVTGFLAKDRQGRLTTLGRNGSDLTASVLAEALGAPELVFYKDVPGILSADPDWLPDARPLGRVTYAEAAELAFHGARVLHPASVAPAVRAQARVALRSLRGAGGTELETRLRREGPVALAGREDVVRLRFPLDLPERRAETLAEAFARLEAAGVVPGLVSADGHSLSVYAEATPALDALQVERETGFSTLALVGHRTGERPAALGLALKALAQAGVTPVAVQQEARAHAQALVVRACDRHAAAQVLHGLLVAPRSAAGSAN